MNSSGKPRVVIVGAGFAGLRAARALARAPVEVLLIDRNNYHLFQPLLYQVASAYLEPEQVAKPVRSILRRQENLRFRVAEVRGVDLARRKLSTSIGSLPYDQLVIAVGSQTSYYGLRSVERNAFGLKTLQDGVRIRNQILECCEGALTETDPIRRQGLLSFAVGGGGSAGVEMAGALAELSRQVLARDYPELPRELLRVLLLEGSQSILPGMPADLCLSALQTLRRKGVEVHLGAFIEDFDGGRIRLRGGEEIPTGTLIWTAGVGAAGLTGRLGVQLAALQRVPVAPSLQLPDHPEVYVIGDCSYLEEQGRALPMVAPVAVQMADVAARNILRQVAGLPARPFRYKNPGLLATIGRNAAVAEIAGIRLKGFLAWAVWLVVHLLRLVGFRNRLMVLISWAWDYFLGDRAVRLILKG